MILLFQQYKYTDKEKKRVIEFGIKGQYQFQIATKYIPQRNTGILRGLLSIEGNLLYPPASHL